MAKARHDDGMKILIIDDDKKLCRLLADYLAPMEYETICVHTGLEGIQKAVKGNFQVIILDVMLPGMDGFEVLKNIRRESDVPILMLTARGDETDRIVGLEMGADDYLPKPFSPRELLARLRSITRRFEKAAKRIVQPIGQQIVVGDLKIDPSSRTATSGCEMIPLTSIEFDLLFLLARSAGKVLTRDHLMDMVAGRDYEIFDRSIDVHISSIRRKLGDDPKQPKFIKTIRGTGYMFAIPSKEIK